MHHEGIISTFITYYWNRKHEPNVPHAVS